MLLRSARMYIYIYIYIYRERERERVFSEFLKQNDLAQIKNPKWLHNKNYICWKVKGNHFRICNYLVSNMNQKCQEEPKNIYSKCLQFSWRHCWMQHAKFLIMHAYSHWVISWIFPVMAVFIAAVVWVLPR